MHVEKWKIINYRDVKENYYEVSNIGRVRRLKDKKILNGEDPKYERCGYKRYGLLSTDGYSKHYQIHRMVLNAFGTYCDELEVNHIDGNKLNNQISNLECVTPLENKHHAKINNLYKSCQDHYKATLTNDQVECICKYLSNGKSITWIIHKLHLENHKHIQSNIIKIINRKSWVRISSKYKFDHNKYHYKTYSYDDIVLMCEDLFINKLKPSEVAKKYQKYNYKKLCIMLKGLKGGRIYKEISRKYIEGFND